MKNLNVVCALLLPFASELTAWAQPSVEGLQVRSPHQLERLQVRQIKYKPGDFQAEVDLYNDGASQVAAYGLITHTIFADGAEHIQSLTGDLTQNMTMRKMSPSSAKRMDGTPISEALPGEHFIADAPALSRMEAHGTSVGFRAEPTFVIYTDGTEVDNGDPAVKRDIAGMRDAWKKEAQRLEKWLPEMKSTYGSSSRATVKDVIALDKRMRADGAAEGLLGGATHYFESLDPETPLGSDAATLAFRDTWMRTLDERAQLLAKLGTAGGK